MLIRFPFPASHFPFPVPPNSLGQRTTPYNLPPSVVNFKYWSSKFSFWSRDNIEVRHWRRSVNHLGRTLRRTYTQSWQHSIPDWLLVWNILPHAIECNCLPILMDSLPEGHQINPVSNTTGDLYYLYIQSDVLAFHLHKTTSKPHLSIEYRERMNTTPPPLCWVEEQER